MSSRYLAIQGTYSSLSVGLFEGSHCLKQLTFNDVRASSSLVSILDGLLKDCQHSLADLDFIAVDKGPGAFTSLRAVIASINGIAFASKVPLIGVNSLEVLEVDAARLAADIHPPATLVAVLNAYNNDLYYRVATGAVIDEGCIKADELRMRLSVLASDQKIVVGNGTAILYPELSPAGDVLLPRLSTIAQLALQQWLNGGKQGEGCIEPYYLKTQLFAIKK